MLKRFFCVLYLLALVQVAQTQSKNGAAKFSPNSSVIATEWMNLIISIVRAEALTPAPSARIFSYSSLALYESQVPSMPGYQSIFPVFSGKKLGTVKKYSPAACANAVLAEIFRKFKFLPHHLKSIDSLEAVIHDNVSKQSSATEIGNAVNFGKEVANEIFNWSLSDGFFEQHPAPELPVGAGFWEPTPEAPLAGYTLIKMPTFINDVKSKSDPGPHPAYSTDVNSSFYKSALDVYQVTKNFSRDDSLVEESWKDTPPKNYNPLTRLFKILTQIIEHENLPLGKVSIIYAKHGMAIFDAIKSCLYLKYKYNLTRPATYIRKVIGDTAWNWKRSVVPGPSYPSLRAAVVAASGTIMESAFGKNYAFIDSSLASYYGARSYSSIRQFVEEASNIRFKTGLNFQFAVDAGMQQGRKIAEMVELLPFRK